MTPNHDSSDDSDFFAFSSEKKSFMQTSYEFARPDYLEKVLYDSKYIMGPEVKELEIKLQEYTKSNYCVTCSSGTDALILSLLALNIGKGDIVFCPSFTFPATAEAILMV